MSSKLSYDGDMLWRLNVVRDGEESNQIAEMKPH